MVGNPTEGALLLWLNDQHTDYKPLRDNAAVTEQLPFSTMRKFMATVVDSGVCPGKRIAYVKGAPEIVIDKCRNFPDGVTKEQLREALLGYQQKAMRTLGFAYQEVGDGKAVESDSLNADNLTFMGIVAISDPVRADVPAAVKESIDAGIKIKIVTGDTPGTAKEIGRQIGLWNDNTDNDSNIITGPDFAALDDNDAADAARRIKSCRAHVLPTSQDSSDCCNSKAKWWLSPATEQTTPLPSTPRRWDCRWATEHRWRRKQATLQSWTTRLQASQEP